MAGVVTTNIVVQFGSEDDADKYHLSAEIDSREDGYNKGKTSFIPGDSPYLLIYKSDELSLSFDVSTGGLSSRSSELIAVDDFVTFANSDQEDVSKPPSGGVTLKRIAGSPGATISNMTISLPEPDVAVWKASYATRAYVYQLVGIPTELEDETSFPVVVFITGTSNA